MKTSTTKHRLMELAGLIKEGSSDRDAIAHFVWSKDEFMEEPEDTLEKLIDELEQEFNASKGNYSNVEEYLDELEQSGGLEGMLNESMSLATYYSKSEKGVTDIAKEIDAIIDRAGFNINTKDELLDLITNLADAYVGEMEAETKNRGRQMAHHLRMKSIR